MTNVDVNGEPASRWSRSFTRLDALLSSRPARVVSTFIAVAALALSLVLGVSWRNLTQCLSEYNDASAISTAARAQAAGEDRKADEADRQADAQDRAAFRSLIDALAAQNQAATQTAFANLVVTYRQTDEARLATALTRKDNERKRAANPVPPPPSLRCG